MKSSRILAFLRMAGVAIVIEVTIALLAIGLALWIPAYAHAFAQVRGQAPETLAELFNGGISLMFSFAGSFHFLAWSLGFLLSNLWRVLAVFALYPIGGVLYLIGSWERTLEVLRPG